jgi:flagellar biosynthesis protein FlhF
MLVKRYVVEEVPEALALIRQDLGADAMILSTKKIKTRTFFGMFTKHKIEVVAASADPVDPITSNDKVQRIGNKIRKTAQPQAITTPPPVAIDLVTPDVENSPKRGIGPYQADAVKSTEKAVGRANVESQTVPFQEDMLVEIRRLRKMVNRLADTKESLPKPLSAIRTILLQQEIDSERVDEIVEELLVSMDDQPWDLSRARFEVQQFLLQEMGHWGQQATINSNTRIAAFVGATGVGKTTTIAKIAAEQVMKHRKKLALITTDTYRIAAVEQLRTYANILNIPIEVAFTPEDYNKSIESFKNYDLILIDTAGRNYHDQKYVEETTDYFRLVRPQEIYLTLSATSKSSDIYKMINNFSDLNFDKFLFTKLDETMCYGLIYNVMRQYRKPFSYVTDGQGVPDDLSVLTPEKLSNLLIGEDTYV